MHRYVSGDKFWTIGLSGKKLTTQFGKIGSPGQTRLKTFATTKAASAAFELAVLVKHKEGFTDELATSTSKTAKSSK